MTVQSGGHLQCMCASHSRQCCVQCEQSEPGTGCCPGQESRKNKRTSNISCGTAHILDVSRNQEEKRLKRPKPLRPSHVPSHQTYHKSGALQVHWDSLGHSISCCLGDRLCGWLALHWCRLCLCWLRGGGGHNLGWGGPGGDVLAHAVQGLALPVDVRTDEDRVLVPGELPLLGLLVSCTGMMKGNKSDGKSRGSQNTKRQYA